MTEIDQPAVFGIESVIAVESAPCAGCCSRREIALTPSDVIFLADRLGIATGRLIRESLIFSESGAFLRHQVNGDCVYFRDNACAVSAARPLACRLYPFQRVSLPGDEPLFILSDEREQTGDAERTSLSKFLEASHAPQAMAAADRYAKLFMELHGELAETESVQPSLETDRLLPLIYDADRMICPEDREAIEATAPDEKINRHIDALRQMIAGRRGFGDFPAEPMQADELAGATDRYSHCVWPVLRRGFFSPVADREGPDGRAGLIVSLLDQMQGIQHWPAEQVREQQFRQIRRLVAHFRATSPWYRKRLEHAGCPESGNLDAETFQQLPVLTRSDFQDAGEALYSSAPPRDHGEINSFTTSGSTGKPVTIRATALADALHWASFIRNDLWHNRDLSKKFAYIQAYRDLEFAAAPEGARFEAWNEAFDTGPLVKLNVVSSTLEEQLAWLRREQPAYLMSFPSSLEALARLCLEQNEHLSWLENISTIGEQFSPAQRQVMQTAWGKPVYETYGCAEATFIAFQSPVSERLLVQSESVYVEILDENNQPCPIGVPGRVVVTTLHNFATPIIRYEVGDLAVPGDPEEGYGLPVIEYVLGRSRNALRLPNGEKAFPLRWSEEMGRIAPVRQWQMIQNSYSELEVRMVVDRPLTGREETEILAAFSRVLGGEFQLRPLYVNEIPRAVSGKFEEFRCEIAD